MTDKRLCVVAKTHKQALAFAEKNNLKPNEWWYPHDRSTMLGLREYPYVKIGVWYLRSDIKEIDLELQLANAKLKE